MTKYIKYHKNYTEFGEPYQLVLPLNLEGLMEYYLTQDSYFTQCNHLITMLED